MWDYGLCWDWEWKEMLICDVKMQYKGWSPEVSLKFLAARLGFYIHIVRNNKNELLAIAPHYTEFFAFIDFSEACKAFTC